MEVLSALGRRQREGSLLADDVVRAGQAFRYDLDMQYQVVELDRAVADVAGDLVTQHPMRAYDAVQLATALSLAKALQSLARSLVFICGDQQLLTAAENEGLVTDDPFDHVEPGSNP